jgi:putative DNA modification/repair radical SAM protein
MSRLDTREKLAILADAAKYDASCASSGTKKRDSLGGKGGIGSTEGMGICHAYAPDGRCISLLKILLTNSCIFDCHYCINRKSSNVRRARFTAEEVVQLTLSFYKRNYIEGLFLSSGIIRSSNYTMEQIVEVARSLREDHDFAATSTSRPSRRRSGADAPGGLHADRVSINVELPTDEGLRTLAPEKDGARIESAMGDVKTAIEEGAEGKKRFKSAPGFAPAGQSTQMIVGADAASDSDIVVKASRLYDRFGLRRVYYSAFSPIPDASAVLPLQRPPLMREHRLYQSDWLMRFYEFKPAEVVQATGADGNLPLDIDPKLAWALKFREHFPVDVNRAPREMLLRVPGLGVKAVDRIIMSRRWRRLGLDDVGRLTVSVAKVRPFIIADGWRPILLTERADLEARLKPKQEQLELFAA